eukprot:Nk52_evm1s2069 gene=Nk52_evmTU1s2069
MKGSSSVSERTRSKMSEGESSVKKEKKELTVEDLMLRMELMERAMDEKLSREREALEEKLDLEREALEEKLNLRLSHEKRIM